MAKWIEVWRENATWRVAVLASDTGLEAVAEYAGRDDAIARTLREARLRRLAAYERDWETGDLEQLAMTPEQYAERHLVPYIDRGCDASDSIAIDGVQTPIQSCRGVCSALYWARSEGWGEIGQFVTDDGDLGTVVWEGGEPSVEYESIYDLDA